MDKLLIFCSFTMIFVFHFPKRRKFYWWTCGESIPNWDNEGHVEWGGYPYRRSVRCRMSDLENNNKKEEADKGCKTSSRVRTSMQVRGPAWGIRIWAQWEYLQRADSPTEGVKAQVGWEVCSCARTALWRMSDPEWSEKGIFMEGWLGLGCWNLSGMKMDHYRRK